MKRSLKFNKNRIVLLAYKRMELSKYFMQANNLVYAQRRGSLTKLVNRCLLTGSSRSYLSDFGMSRQTFRHYANKGYLPGVRKSSW